ncbi:MAG: hypothetical protein R3B07_27690 [Polyangiaceae bacterium]
MVSQADQVRIATFGAVQGESLNARRKPEAQDLMIRQTPLSPHK